MASIVAGLVITLWSRHPGYATPAALFTGLGIDAAPFEAFFSHTSLTRVAENKAHGNEATDAK